MNIPLLNNRPKAKAQILIVLDDTDNVTVSTSSRNPVTNMGLLAIAGRMLQLGVEKVAQPKEKES